MPIERKRGALSDDDMKFIRTNYQTMPIEEMAKLLNRNTAPIRRYVAKVSKGFIKKKEERKDYIAILRAKHYWSELKKQLLDNEVAFFEQEWSSYLQQFPDTVHTDEIMIADTIMLTIQINRCLEDKRRMLSEMDSIQHFIDDELKLPEEQRDRDALSNWHTQMNAVRISLANLDKRYLDIQQRKDAKFSHLKATRDQRLERVQNSTKNFFELVKMLDDRAERLRQNRAESLILDAAAETKKQLMSQRKYADGQVDSPLLSSDTIEFLNTIDDEEDANNQEIGVTI